MVTPSGRGRNTNMRANSVNIWPAAPFQLVIKSSMADFFEPTVFIDRVAFLGIRHDCISGGCGSLDIDNDGMLLLYQTEN
jgi:hypothetical protein